MNLAMLNVQDFQKMADEIQEISDTKSEDQLFVAIGNNLHDRGYTVCTAEDSFELIEPKAFDASLEKFSMIKSLEFVENTEPLSEESARKEGRKFWKRFQQKLKTAICNNPQLKDLFAKEGTLKDYLIVGIPIVLAAIGITSTLGPLALALVASIFALIAKVGFETYCEIN